MKNGKIYLFISNHLESVEQHLYDFKKDKKLEHLHRLRVDIKKIRAIISFIENIYDKKLEIKSLKLLFNKAGELREFDINIAQLSLLPSPPQTLIIKLIKKEDRLQQKFVKNIPRYIKLVKEVRKKSFISFPLPGKKLVNNYLGKKRRKAAKCFESKKRVNMHQFRKLIKRIMYVYELLPKKKQKAVKLDPEFINELQNEVGAWHDTYATVSFLSRKHFPRKDEYISILNKIEMEQFDNLSFKYPNLRI